MADQTFATEAEATTFLEELDGKDKSASDLLARLGFEQKKAEGQKAIRAKGKAEYRTEKEIATSIQLFAEETERGQRESEQLALTDLGTFAHDHLLRFEAARAHYEQAPGLVATFERSNGGGMTEASLLACWQLDHDVQSTTEATLRGQHLTALELLAMYESALEAGIAPTAPVVQVIERHRGDLLSVIKPFDPLRDRAQSEALGRLRGLTAETREGRVPRAILDAVQAATEAKRRVETLTRTRKISLVTRRELEGAGKGR